MAATYALPLPSPTMNGHAHSGHHSHHSHSHTRNVAPQRSPLRPASMNETSYSVNGLQTSNGFLKPDMPPQHQPASSADIFYDIPQEQAPPGQQILRPHPSFSTPNGVRAKSTERRKSVGLPTHLRLQPSDYGFPPPITQRSRASTLEEKAAPWLTITEVLTSMLTPLPYIISSLTFTASSALLQHDTDTVQPNYGEPKLAFSWLKICSLTSMSLVFVGVYGKIITSSTHSLQRKKSLGGEETFQRRDWALLSRRIGARLLSVGLPFYATSILGGSRVALVLLTGMASDMMNIDRDVKDYVETIDWYHFLHRRRWIFGSIVLQLLYDQSQVSAGSGFMKILLGYFALLMSILFLPPPFPSSTPRMSFITRSPPASEMATSAVLATPWETPSQLRTKSLRASTISPLICTAEDVNLTLVTGISTVIIASTMSVFSATGGNSTSLHLLPEVIIALTAALTFTMIKPESLKCNRSLGLVIGSAFSSFSCLYCISSPSGSFVLQGVFIGISFALTRLDTLAASPLPLPSKQHNHHHQSTHNHVIQHGDMSRLSAFLIGNIPHGPWGTLLVGILAEKDTRRIFYFMCLNLAFMTFQTFVGVVTGSLGLLSDSIHMFFDCVALVVGMCAAVMSKWPPSTRFPYGYGKMDSLSGFANGIFLMLISVEIIYEAIERLGEGHEVKELGELFITSVGGLLVNVVGLTAFGHAHHGHSHAGHSHGGHGGHEHTEDSHAGHQHSGDHHHHDENHVYHERSQHDHELVQDHAHRDHSPEKHDYLARGAHSNSHFHDHLTAPTPSPSIYSSVPVTPSKSVHNHPHSHSHFHSHGHGPNGYGHSHDHGSDNMMGIYLHIAADAIGSASVIASTAMIYWTGWSGWDALASSLTAILIFGSAIPLVKTSARNLLLTVPAGTEYDLREALTGLSSLRGIVSYTVPKFWLESGEGSEILGVIHVIASNGADLEDVKERSVAFLKGRHMKVVVQVEREGNGRCWCQAAK